jgi:CheY-like chemotaxis protein
LAAEADILLADDDDVGRYVTATMLRRAGFTVREAVDGQQALDEALRQPPDLAILDVKMPGLDGFEACRRLKEDERTLHIPVLLLSATFLESEAQVEGLETGADAYLTQPIEAPVLAATARALLRTRRAESEVRTAARQWRTTFDAITDAVAVVDEDFVLRRVNRAFAALFGVDPGTLVGSALDAVSGPLHVAARAPGETGEVALAGRTLRVRLDAIPTDPTLQVSGEMVMTLSDVTAERRAQRERAEALARERTISRTLQQSLLPERLPRNGRLLLDAWHLAAEKELIIGGDWYDVIERDGWTWLVIGDIAGHGVAAAAQAGQLRHSLRVYAHEGFALSEVVRRLNELVVGTGLTGMATLCIMAVEADTGNLRLVRAGHPPPLLVPGDGSAPRLIEGIAGVVLGVPGGTAEEHASCLEPGDRVVLYTDGLIERPKESLDRGLERMLAAAPGAPDLPTLRANLVSRLVDVADLRDDVALLLAERR